MKNKFSYRILVMAVLTLIIVIYTYMQADDKIVIHWNLNGDADGYAPKLILFALPLLIPAVDWLMILVMRLEPRKNNMRKSAVGYHTVRFIIAALLFTCTLLTCVDTLYPKSLKIDVIAPFFVGVMIMVIGNILPKIHSNYTIGIRNRWTLENEAIWRKTQRLSGWLWFIGGIVICILSLLLTIHRLVLLFIIFTIIIFPNLYAYYLYQKMRKEKTYD